ncbi:MFS transporter [Echinicola sediminis]
MIDIKKQNQWIDNIGLPKQLIWGYLGVLIFMMGDGIEQGWLSPYLMERGLSIQQSASLFTVYGITIALASWFSGVLTEMYGMKRTMTIGLMFYVLGTIGFIGLGLNAFDFNMMLITYALRGFGYPLFAYSFLVWLSYKSSKNQLGKAVGWFWFVFTGGLNVLGAYYSSWAIEKWGYLETLWSSIFWVILGAVFAIIIQKGRLERKNNTSKLKELNRGISIMKDHPKVLLGGVVRVINTTAQFAFPVFIPSFFGIHGISTTEWLQIWGTVFTANIAFNLFFGFVGDKFGWRNTVMWFGGVGCGISTLLFYYSAQWSGGSFWAVLGCGVLWGALLAGYVPLSALVPSLVKDDKGAAMSVLNLGAGLPVFVGPALVGLFIGVVGSEGIVWILSGLYFISSLITYFIQLPEEEEVVMTSEESFIN